MGIVFLLQKNNWESVCYDTYELTINWRGKEETNN